MVGDSTRGKRTNYVTLGKSPKKDDPVVEEKYLMGVQATIDVVTANAKEDIFMRVSQKEDTGEKNILLASLITYMNTWWLD